MIRHILIGLFAAVVAIVVVAVAQPKEQPAISLDPPLVKIGDLEQFMPKPTSLHRAPATPPVNPLNTIVQEAVFDGVPLNEVITFLRNVTGANIDVNWYALRAEGVEPTATVTMNQRNVPALIVLSRALESAAANHRILKYRLDEHGIVCVSTPEYLSAETDIRLYNVRDLLINAMRFHRSFQHTARGGGPAPSLAGTTVHGGVGITWQEGDLGDQLRQLIMDTVDRDEWIEHGGRSAAIHYWAGKLLVVQTAQNHDEIERFLNLLREE